MHDILRWVTPTLWATAISLFPMPALAVAPDDVWTAADTASGWFSADGGSMLVSTPTGFQLRQADDGRLTSTIVLSSPTAYSSSAFSPDERYVALAYRGSGSARIELWSVATGELARTIAVGGGRVARGLDVSRQGLIAVVERVAHGGGSLLRLFRPDDDRPATLPGPAVPSQPTDSRFSPGGAYVAIQERHASGTGVRILRTADLTSASFIGESASLFAWSGDASLWVRRGMSPHSTLFERVAVPTGEVIDGFAIDGFRYAATSFTPDGRYLLASTIADDALVFLRTTDGLPDRSYEMPRRTRAGSVSPRGDLFSYAVCGGGSACMLHVARMPDS